MNAVGGIAWYQYNRRWHAVIEREDSLNFFTPLSEAPLFNEVSLKKSRKSATITSEVGHKNTRDATQDSDLSQPSSNVTLSPRSESKAFDVQLSDKARKNSAVLTSKNYEKGDMRQCDVNSENNETLNPPMLRQDTNKIGTATQIKDGIPIVVKKRNRKAYRLRYTWRSATHVFCHWQTRVIAIALAVGVFYSAVAFGIYMHAHIPVPDFETGEAGEPIYIRDAYEHIVSSGVRWWPIVLSRLAASTMTKCSSL